MCWCLKKKTCYYMHVARVHISMYVQTNTWEYLAWRLASPTPNILTARRPALVALFIATVATGTPLGICRLNRKEPVIYDQLFKVVIHWKAETAELTIIRRNKSKIRATVTLIKQPYMSKLTAQRDPPTRTHKKNSWYSRVIQVNQISDLRWLTLFYFSFNLPND